MKMLLEAKAELNKSQQIAVYLRPWMETNSEVFTQSMYFGSFEYMRAELEVVHQAE